MLFLLACTINVNKGGDDSTPEAQDSAPPQVTLAPDFRYIYADGRSDQLYATAFSGGRFAVSDPFRHAFTGSVHVLPEDPPDGLNLDDATRWDGDGFDSILGVNLEGVSDGTLDYFCSQTYGVNEAGQLLCVPSDQGAGTLSQIATLTADGAVGGDYFGTGVTVSGGALWVSSTTGPKLYRAPLSALGGGDFSDFADMNVPLSPSGGFLYMDMAGGSDGFAAVSHGGFVQHFQTDGTPDWWYSVLQGDGSGLMPVEKWIGRDTASVVRISRITEGYAVSVVGSGVSALTTETIILSPSGEILDTLQDVTSIVEGEKDGHYWRMEGVFYYLGNDFGKGGYIRLKDYAGNVIGEYGLPFESPYECLPDISTDGESKAVLVCRYASYGTWISL